MDLLVPQGTLLAAAPDLRDENFMHALVLICRHGAEGGFGLIVNKPTALTTRHLLAEHPILGKLDVPVHLGGPVDHSTLQFVHCLQDELPGGLPLGASRAADGTEAEEVALGGELEALAQLLARDRRSALSRVRLFLGYSGWSPGQLEQELRMGSWLPVPLFAGAIFAEDEISVWRRALRSLGAAGGGLEHLPPDVSWN